MKVEAYTEKRTLKGNRLEVDLPENFRDRLVEVIVLPITEAEQKEERSLLFELMENPLHIQDSTPLASSMTKCNTSNQINS